jgi:hypothetical protein
LDPVFFTKVRHFFFGEVRAVVDDDVVRVPIAVYRFLHELRRCFTVALFDGIFFHTLCEFADDEQVSVTAGGCFEFAHHIHAPNGERPREGDGLEREAWHVRLARVFLAPGACVDEFECVGVCG